MIGSIKMYYLYVGYYVNENTFAEILRNKINNMSVARQKFEYNIIRGLHRQLGDHVNFISYVPTDGSLTIPKSSEVEGATINHIAIKKNSVGSIAIAYSLFKKYLKDLGEEKLQNLRVLMYAVIPPFEQALLKYKKIYGFRMVTICSEVPELRRYSKSLLSNIKKKVLTYYNEQFDGYILFSEAMKEVVRVGKKPCLVMEGIAPDIRSVPKAGKKNIVMYAGGLASDNNIPLLVECCKQIDELDELWICGIGPDEKQIEKLAAGDQRVKYYGQLPNEKVLEMETNAKVLINFRNPEEKLTRYSFPSKILEYIASGSLVMSTRLIGIPEEYFNYIVPIEIDDKQCVVTQIKKIFQLDNVNYLEMCKKAQKYITENKNYTSQSIKIIKMLSLE